MLLIILKYIWAHVIFLLYNIVYFFFQFILWRIGFSTMAIIYIKNILKT